MADSVTFAYESCGRSFNIKYPAKSSELPTETIEITPKTSQSPNRLHSGDQHETQSKHENTEMIKKWKKQNETENFEKLVANRADQKDQFQKKSDLILKNLQKIPIDVLTKDFLDDKIMIDKHGNSISCKDDDKAYLIDEVLPSLVFGLQYILKEAQQREIIENEASQPNFNPINILARYLLRNNPKWSNFSEASAYVRGLREAADVLRHQMFTMSDSKLAKLKATAQQRREQRRREEQRKKDENLAKSKAQEQLFNQFVHSGNTKIDSLLIYRSVKAFTEIIERMPDELKHHMRTILSIDENVDMDVAPEKLSRKEFNEFLDQFTEEMPMSVFELFCQHMNKCANLHKVAAEREKRENILTNLFISCDIDQIGLLDRQRILQLFHLFYNSLDSNLRPMVKDPTLWPIRNTAVTMNEMEEKRQKTMLSMPEAIQEEQEDQDEETQNIKDAEVIEPTKEIDSETNLEVAHEEEINQTHEDTQKREDKDDETRINLAIEELKNEEETEQKELDFSEDKKGEDKNKQSEDETEKQDEVQKPESLKDENEEISNNELQANTEEKPQDDQVEESKIDQMEDKETDKLDDVQENIEKEKLDLHEDEKNIEIIGEDSNKVIEEEPQSSDANKIDEIKPENIDSNIAEETVNNESKENEEALEKPEDKSIVLEEPKAIEQIEDDGLETTVEKDNNEEMAKIVSEKSNVSYTSSAFDEENINSGQFIQLTESFLGDALNVEMVEELSEYIRNGYQETEDERLKRIQKTHQKAMSARRKHMLEILFDKWDNDGSGYLELYDIETVFLKYKEEILNSSIRIAKKQWRKTRKSKHDTRLNLREFRNFLYMVAEAADILGNDSLVEELIGFLITIVERSQADKLRGDARKKWLRSIEMAGETSCGKLEHVFRSVFQSLYKDAEQHGNGKKISANICLLESLVKVNSTESEETESLKTPYKLRCVAATLDDSTLCVGRYILPSTKAVSFKAIEDGRPKHIPRASSDPFMFYFNDDYNNSANHRNMPLNEESHELDGAVLIVPIMDSDKRVFGTISIDTMKDPKPADTVFEAHEIAFVQGVARAFSVAYHRVDLVQKILRLTLSAFQWISRRIPNIITADFYLRERAQTSVYANFILRRAISTSETQTEVTILDQPPRLERNENLFRNYLFKVVDTSESVTSEAYGQRHIASPLRDLQGLAVAVVDLGIGKLKNLPPNDYKEITRMLNLLHLTFGEILKTSRLEETLDAMESRQEQERKREYEEMNDDEGEEPGNDTEAENQKAEEKKQKRLANGWFTVGNLSSAELLFDQLMLIELRENVSKLDNQAYAELKSYVDPPAQIVFILKMVLGLMYPEHAVNNQLDQWDKIKKLMTGDLSRRIVQFDPIENSYIDSWDFVNEILFTKIVRSEIGKHGSKPALDLYNWAFCCINIMHQHRK